MKELRKLQARDVHAYRRLTKALREVEEKMKRLENG